MKTFLLAALFGSVCFLLPGFANPSYDDLSDPGLTSVDAVKEYRIGVSGVCGLVKDEYILVTHVIPGSPAYGKVREEDRVRALQYRGLGGGAEAIRQTVGKRIYRLGRDDDWHLYMTVERPSLLNGKGNTLTFDLRMPRPSAAQYHFGPIGFFARINQDHLEVDLVDTGSPATGKLNVGDRILSVNGKPVTGDVFALFAECVDQAESVDGGGILELKVLRPAAGAGTAGSGMPAAGKNEAATPGAAAPASGVDGQLTPVSVAIKLQSLGRYSDTSPVKCPKTDAIITRTAERLIDTKEYGQLNTGLLALLATGEKNYINHVGGVIRAASWARPDIELPITGGYVSWGRAYQTIALCEYFLLTGDKYVLPAIEKYAHIIAMGQDAAGLWNHQSASPDANFGKYHGRLYGYGAINQTSIALWIALILSRECGVKDPEVDMAVEKTRKLYSYWIERGKLPYGNHDAGEDFFTNNGTSGSVAVGFALLNDLKGASFFSKMSAAAAEEVLTGHTGPWFNIFWSGIGANVSGPEMVKAYNNEVHWLRTVTRTWDGRFLHMEAWGCKAGDYGLGSSSAYLLNLAAGRRALRITGRGMDKSLWLDAKAAQQIVDAGKIDYASKSIEELVALLGHELPPVRLRSVEMLAIKDARVSDKVLLLLANGTRNQRIGAIHAVSALKISAVEQLIAVVRNAEDDLWIRQLALRALSNSEGAGKYARESLALLAKDKPYDVQGRFDEDLGQALVKLTNSDPYSAGFDKDLFYSAVRKLLDHKREGARNAGMALLKNMPIEDLHIIAEKMVYVIKDTDRTYVSYHGDTHRQAGLNILYGLNIDESLDLALDTINEKVGRGWRKNNRVAFIKTWGMEARRVIPKIEEVLGMEAGEYVKIIEAADTGKKMISLEDAVKTGGTPGNEGAR